MSKLYSKTKLNIRTLDHLSKRLKVPLHELEKIADTVESLYKFDKEPKKSGGFREIAKPHQILKRIQRAIHELLMEIKIAESAHGGIKKHSTFTNAKPHSKQSFLLNLDLKSFFPNISHYKVYEMFNKGLGCPLPVASLLTRLTTVKGQVPQGGPTSTDIANLVMKNTDKRLEGLSKKFNIKYTRYVDDMTFSGKSIHDRFIVAAKDIISQSGFLLNYDKEAFSDNSKPKIVTGLSVTRKKPNVPRKIKRQVKKEEFLFKKFNNPGDVDMVAKGQQITGRKAYINYIDNAR